VPWSLRLPEASPRRLTLAEEGASVQDNWSQKRNKGNPTVTASLDGEIRDGRHHMQVRVYFEDTDSGQIVYHANFLRFMERGRTNYLRLLGTNQQALLKEARNDAPDFAFVVRSMTIDFLKPAVLDDLLDVVTVPQEVRGASIALLQECRRADDLLVTARVRVAFVSGGKAQRIPKSLRLAMEGAWTNLPPRSRYGLPATQ
jgi:acyl-CoA thioester hydrolase